MSNIQSNINLRFIEKKDAHILMELNNNKQIADFVVGNPQHVNIEKQLSWIENLNKEKNIKRWIICFNEQAVGTVFLSSIDFSNKVGNVNIKILPRFQGKGIGKQALSLLCNIAFDELGLFCLTANVLSYNTKSKELFEKCGFRVDGILRSRVIKNGKRFKMLL